MDKVNGVVYINPNQKQFNKLQLTNRNKNINNSMKKKIIIIMIL